MRFGWKVLLPVATINAVVTAACWWSCDLRLASCRSRSTASRASASPSSRSSRSRSRSSTRSTSGRVYPRFRGRHRLHRARERAREVRRLLALRRRLPGRLHPRRRGREHRRQPRLGRRALRAHLRDQHEPLHLLRLLRARLPVRRDHARQRVRALRVLARRPDLHEGHAARRADQDGCRSRTRSSTTRRFPYYKAHS